MSQQPNSSEQSYLGSIASELLAKYRRLDSVLSHAPSKGTYHENILRSMLRGYLPNTFSVGEGFISNQQSEVSSQLDILIVDNFDPRSFSFREDNFYIASDFGVCSFGEVKTSPTKNDFIKSFHKLVRTSTLLEESARSTSFMFCYDAPVGRKAFVKWVNEAIKSMPPEYGARAWNLPDYIFCMKLGITQQRDKMNDNPDAVSYSSRYVDDKRFNKGQMLIIQELVSCVNNGCGRMRNAQGIKLRA